MGDLHFVFPWWNHFVRAVDETLNYIRNCQAFHVSRKILQTARDHPVMTILLGALVVHSFFPLLLLAAFTLGSTGFVLTNILMVQGGALFLFFFSFIAVVSTVVVFTACVVCTMYIMYYYALFLCHCVSYVANIYYQAASLRSISSIWKKTSA